MKSSTKILLENCKRKYDFIKELEEEITEVFYILKNCYVNKNKILVCGNGGSAADSDHIVGELVKGFRKLRPFSEEIKEKYIKLFGEKGKKMAEMLQESLPAINLCAHTSLITAIINDIGAEEIFSQQIIGYGNEGDVLLGITTSGNSKNILHAGMTAKVKKLKTIVLTGRDGGEAKHLFDYSIIVPFIETCDIQNAHIVIYHLLCAMLENEFWEK